MIKDPNAQLKFTPYPKGCDFQRRRASMLAVEGLMNLSEITSSAQIPMSTIKASVISTLPISSNSTAERSPHAFTSISGSINKTLLRKVTMSASPSPTLQPCDTSRVCEEEPKTKKRRQITDVPTKSHQCASKKILVRVSNPNDVILAPGTAYISYSGNQAYQALIKERLSTYLNSQGDLDLSNISSAVAKFLAKSVVGTVGNKQPSGRFLREDKESGLWCDTGYEDAVVRTIRIVRREIRNLKASNRVSGPSPCRKHEEKVISPVNQFSTASAHQRHSHADPNALLADIWRKERMAYSRRASRLEVKSDQCGPFLSGSQLPNFTGRHNLFCYQPPLATQQNASLLQVIQRNVNPSIHPIVVDGGTLDVQQILELGKHPLAESTIGLVIQQPLVNDVVVGQKRNLSISYSSTPSILIQRKKEIRSGPPKTIFKHRMVSRH